MLEVLEHHRDQIAASGVLSPILLGYCLLPTLMRGVYIRRYGWQ